MSAVQKIQEIPIIFQNLGQMLTIFENLHRFDVHRLQSKLFLPQIGNSTTKIPRFQDLCRLGGFLECVNSLPEGLH